jgi:hypothetical protein
MSKKMESTAVSVVSEVVDDTPTPVGTQKRNIHCLLVNDTVSTKGVPIGGWYAIYRDFKSEKSWGPIPLMTPTKNGQAQFMGFVDIDDLRSTAEYEWDHTLQHGEVASNEEGSRLGISLDVSSGSNKMMSVWITK